MLDGPGGTIVNLAAGAKGKLAALAADKKAALYQTAGGWVLGRTIGRVDDPRVLADRVLKVDFHPNGTWLATAGGEAGTSGELKIWNVADGRLVREFPGRTATPSSPCSSLPTANSSPPAGPIAW